MVATASPEARLPAAFGISRITDWAEAERLLGYSILRSPTFPLTWPHLFVQPAVDEDPSTPHKAVALYKIDGEGVRLTVAPAGFWPEGAMELGQPLEIDGHQGWLQHWGSSSVYMFPCAESAVFGPVWCKVEVSSTPPELLTRFVCDLVP